MKMIDANELLKELEKVCNSLQMMDNSQRADLIMSGIYVAKRHVQEMLTVDIIRCKDCRAFKTCSWSEKEPQGFCAWAEPKQR